MEIEFEKLQAVLDNPKNKTAKKYLTALSEELRREDPARWAELTKKAYTQEPCKTLAQRFRRARTLCIAALVLAAAVVIAAYLLGDFGSAILVGWGERYLLSGAVVLAMSLLVLAGLYSGRTRDLLLAAALLEKNRENEGRC